MMKKGLKNTQEIREYTRLLKNFYGELYSYVIVNGGLVLFWLFSGAGYFWPIWVIAIWGISLLIKASKLHIIDSFFYEQCHSLREKFLFLKKDWEEEKTRELVERLKREGVLEEENKAHAASKTAPTPSAKPAAAAPKRVAIKKAAVKKSRPAAKKVPARKPVAKKTAPKK